MVRLAILADFPEEGWPSMDLCAIKLAAHLPAAVPELRALYVVPPFRHLARTVPLVGRRNAACNFDRMWNRFRTYPRHVTRLVGDFEFFHVVDHSYAQLANHVTAGRAGVYCHDLDAFRCLLEPEREQRPWWFRRMTRR